MAALADDHIAQARQEKLDSMKKGYCPPPGNANPSNDYSDAVAYEQATTGFTAPYRPATVMEQLTKSASFHFDEHVRAQQGASFLKAHPEFEEFLRLFRAGVFLFAIFALCAVAAFAQKPAAPPPAPPLVPPVLDTAERTALQALEKQKQEAQSQFSQAQQAEAVIEREFITAHAGFHINPQTFVVEPNASQATAGAPAKAPPALLHRPSTASPAK